MRREALRLQIEDVKQFIYLTSCMDELLGGVMSEIVDDYRDKLHEMELQLKETEVDIY